MNTHHTPGPWHVSFNTIRQGPVVIADCAPLKEVEANARLIAAAPELLEALQECITSEGATCFSDMQDHPERMQRRLYAITDIARAAIAKATQP